VRVEHIGLFVKDLGRMRRFYAECFCGAAEELYENPATGFRSYFIRLGSGARIELMHMAARMHAGGDNYCGMYHIALAFASKAEVELATRRVVSSGGQVLREARISGLGDFVSTVADPEGNVLELLVLKEDLK